MTAPSAVQPGTAATAAAPGRRSIRAVRWYGAGDLRLETVELPPPGPGEVLVEVAYCGVCGSDLHEIADGPHAIPVDVPHALSGAVAPLTLGHEFSGTVAAVGPGVDGVTAGDRVAVEPNYRCGRCTACRDGRYEVCDAFGFAGLMGDGGMAEAALVPAYMVRPLPAAFDLAAAAVLEPAAVALHGIRRSTSAPGGSALVVGLGPVGLLVCALLRERGAGLVVGVDPVPARRELAARLGADVVLAPDEEVPAVVRRLTGGDGADVAFEVVGAQATLDTGLAGLRRTTSVGYRDCHDELVALASAGRLDLAALVSDVVPLGDAPAVLTRMAGGGGGGGGGGVKTLVRCSPEVSA